ncbi:MAG: PEP-CTERM sorting domain-containing protein [Okeania sp. SIO1H6]|nr:PEP-CTERM sorting domain-containing protein [Okeania sp. SIO1H6]
MKKIILPTALRNFACASAALLACCSIVVAPLAAEAFTLIKNDDGYVREILDLEVEGEKYDVEFIFGTYNNIYNGTFDFSTEQEATLAAQAVMDALGLEDILHFGGEGYDDFYVPYGWYDDNWVWGMTDLQYWRERDLLISDAWSSKHTALHYAKFSSSKAVPEPNLILGLIILGGLMLGSRKKEKA